MGIIFRDLVHINAPLPFPFLTFSFENICLEDLIGLKCCNGELSGDELDGGGVTSGELGLWARVRVLAGRESETLGVGAGAGAGSEVGDGSLTLALSLAGRGAATGTSGNMMRPFSSFSYESLNSSEARNWSLSSTSLGNLDIREPGGVVNGVGIRGELACGVGIRGELA